MHDEPCIDQPRESRLKQHLPRFLVVLVLLAGMHLPAFLYVYPTQDQCRTFRHGLNTYPNVYEAISARGLIPFCVLTGRPFIPIGEALEHGLIRSVSQFFWSRLAFLVVWAVGVWLLSLVISSQGRSATESVVVSVVACTVPGMDFFFMQGLTALMIAVSFGGGIGAFMLYDRWRERRENRRDLVKSIVLLLACFMCYPLSALAFVIPLFLQFLNRVEQECTTADLWKAFQRGCFGVVFVIGMMAVYFMFTKSMVLTAKAVVGYLPELGTYSVELSPADVLGKTVSFVRDAPSVSAALWGLGVWDGMQWVVLGVVLAGATTRIVQSRRFLPVATVLLVTGLLYLFFSVPYLFSKMPTFSLRYIYGSTVLFCIAFLEFYFSLFGRNRRAAALIVLAVASGLHIEFIRRSVSNLAQEHEFVVSELKREIDDCGGLGQVRAIHYIRPETPNYQGWDFASGEYASGVFSCHPGHPWQITTAYLRELFPREVLAELSTRDARFDPGAVLETDPADRQIVVSQSKPGQRLPFKSDAHTVVIDLANAASVTRH